MLFEGTEVDDAWDVEEMRCVAIAGRQVLGDNRRAIQSLPDEPVEADRGRNATPDDRGLDPGGAQDLRHLRNVSEHVRQIADAHRTTEVLGALQAGL